MDNNPGMKIGLRLRQTDEHRATKQNIISLAEESENAGFDSAGFRKIDLTYEPV